MAAIESAFLCSAIDFLKAERISTCNLASAVGLNLSGGLLILPLRVTWGVTTGLTGGLGPCWGDWPASQSSTFPCLDVPAAGDLAILEALANGFGTSALVAGDLATTGIPIGGSGTLALGCLMLILIFGKLILISGIGGPTGPSGAAGASKSWSLSHSNWLLSWDRSEWTEPISNSGIPNNEPASDTLSAGSSCTELWTDTGASPACSGSDSTSELSTFISVSCSGRLLSINFW